MRRGAMSLGFPPFSRAVKWLVISNAAIFLLLAILNVTDSGRAFATAFVNGSVLVPSRVLHGEVWRLLTYAFVNGGLLYVLFGLLALWMFGSEFESRWGTSVFVQFYFSCAFGAALTVLAAAYGLHALKLLGMTPDVATSGLNGPLYGVLAAFGVLYGDREILMFPLPFTMRARYMVIIWLLIALYLSISSGPAGIASIALLGGALFGYVWVKLVPERGLGYYFSERYFGWRNRYYKWKRRRAARKFEVYMSKHDRSEFFDEYGNYLPPDDRSVDPKKGNGEGGKGRWVQ
jgi:membrane associated rhomboid family serine protease